MEGLLFSTSDQADAGSDTASPFSGCLYLWHTAKSIDMVWEAENSGGKGLTVHTLLISEQGEEWGWNEVLEMGTKMGWQKNGSRHRHMASDWREDRKKKYMRERSQQKPVSTKLSCQSYSEFPLFIPALMVPARGHWFPKLKGAITALLMKEVSFRSVYIVLCRAVCFVIFKVCDSICKYTAEVKPRLDLG